MYDRQDCVDEEERISRKNHVTLITATSVRVTWGSAPPIVFQLLKVVINIRI